MVILFGEEVPSHHKEDEVGKYNRALPCWCAIDRMCEDLNRTLGWDANVTYYKSGDVSIIITRNGLLYECVSTDIWDYKLANMLYNRLKLIEEYLGNCTLDQRIHNCLTN